MDSCAAPVNFLTPCSVLCYGANTQAHHIIVYVGVQGVPDELAILSPRVVLRNDIHAAAGLAPLREPPVHGLAIFRSPTLAGSVCRRAVRQQQV